jgi:hypothetical protein
MVELEQMTKPAGRVRVLKCPTCGISLRWLRTEAAVCMSCWQSLPLGISLATVDEARIDFYNEIEIGDFIC